MKLNVMIKTAFVAIFAGVLASGCEDACLETELDYTLSHRFHLEAFVHGPNGTELAGKTVEFRTYKEPCGEAPKGHFGWTGITDGSGSAFGNISPYYNLNNEDDLIVASATLIDGDNPSQTKTQTFKPAQLQGLGGGSGLYFHFEL